MQFRFVTGAEVVDIEEATAEPIINARAGNKRKRNDTEGSESDWEDVMHSSDEDEPPNGDNQEATFLTLEEKAKKAAEVTSNRFAPQSF